MNLLCIGGEYYIVESEQLTFDPFPPSDRKNLSLLCSLIYSDSFPSKLGDFLKIQIWLKSKVADLLNDENAAPEGEGGNYLTIPPL